MKILKVLIIFLYLKLSELINYFDCEKNYDDKFYLIVIIFSGILMVVNLFIMETTRLLFFLGILFIISELCFLLRESVIKNIIIPFIKMVKQNWEQANKIAIQKGNK